MNPSCKDRAWYMGLVIDGKAHCAIPVVGATFHTERLGEVRIVKVHPLGTVDVVKVGTDSYFRVSGMFYGGDEQ